MRYLIVLLLLGMITCARKPVDRFVLQGIVPGAKDSTEVILFPKGKGGFHEIRGYVVKGKFELQGKMNTPTYCLLRFNDFSRSEKQYREIGFFVENGVLEFKTPDIDSLPLAFKQYDIRKEKNYKVTGSEAQVVFYLYQQQTIFLRYTIKTLEESSEKSQHVEEFKWLQKEREKLDKLSKEFIQDQQNLVVNLYVAKQLKKKPFTYDQAYLDELKQLFVSYQDTSISLNEFQEYLQEASAFAKGRMLENAVIFTIEEKEVQLLDQLSENDYTFIDFWASWCGSCRSSFPHLKKLYKRYGDKVKFVSISLDTSKKGWKKALEEEQMSWEQFLGDKQLTSSIGKLYRITSIPRFLLISPRGEIIYSGSNCGELELQLEVLD